MEKIKDNEMNLSDVDEAEALSYGQLFGVFDKDRGDFVSVKFESEKEINLADEVLWVSDDYKSDPDEPDDFTFELMTAIAGKEGMRTEKEARDRDNAERDIDKIISVLSEKEISSMVATFRINGISVEYVSDEKAGEKYLSKEAQLAKIKEVIKGFKNVVVVYSQEELKELQDEYKRNQEYVKPTVDKTVPGKYNEEQEPEVKTQVYIRISEEDYRAVKNSIENEDIEIVSNKVTTRDDKKGINMIIKAADADKVRDMLQQNKISILQDVDGNIDWVDIKEHSKKIENITVGQLREFQQSNKDKFDYVAFRKEGKYTVFVDKECNIAIGQKTLSEVNKAGNKEANELKQLNSNEYVSLENFIKEHKNDKIEILSPSGYINIMPGQTEFHAHNGHSGIPISFDEIKNEVISVKDINYDNENGTWYVISKPQSVLSERKTLKQIESKVEEHKKNESTKKTGLKDKSNINREDVR